MEIIKSKDLALLDDIKELEKELEEHRDPEPWPSSIFEMDYANPAFNVYTAKEDGKVIGFLFGQFSETTQMEYLSYIVVKKSHQGKGIGKALLDAWAKDIKKPAKVFLFAYSGSVGFYEKLGFKKINTLTEMQLDLNSE